MNRLALLALIGLSACTEAPRQPVTVDQAEAMVTLSKSPSGIAQMRRECINGTKIEAKDVPKMADLLEVDEQNVLPVFCERMTNAMANGTLTPEEMVEITKGENPAALMRAILRPSGSAS